MPLDPYVIIPVYFLSQLVSVYFGYACGYYDGLNKRK